MDSNKLLNIDSTINYDDLITYNQDNKMTLRRSQGFTSKELICSDIIKTS